MLHAEHILLEVHIAHPIEQAGHVFDTKKYPGTHSLQTPLLSQLLQLSGQDLLQLPLVRK
jgi:hypothetical protein